MSIQNNLTNCADLVRHGLMTRSHKTVDTTWNILTTRMRYVTGRAEGGFHFAELSGTPGTIFFDGHQEMRSTDADPQTTAVIAPWKNNATPIQLVGTELQKMVGMTSKRLTDGNQSMGDLSLEQQGRVIDWLLANAVSSFSQFQRQRIQALWGRREGMLPTDPQNFPVSLPEVFDTSGSTYLYGESQTVMGEFEEGHIWERETFGASSKNKFSPRVWDWRTKWSSADAGGSKGTGDARTFGVGNTADEDLEELLYILEKYTAVCPGQKVAICSHGFMAKLSFMFKDSDKFPALMGERGWEFRINTVRLGEVLFVADPNKPESDDSIYVLDLGNPGADDSAIFPVYWIPDVDASESMETIEAYMNQPTRDGMIFGQMRPAPWWITEFEQIAGYVDTIAAQLREMYLLAVPEPWRLLLIDQITPFA